MWVIWFLFALSNVWGALPPLAQSSREVQAILSDERTLELLGSAERLQSIVKIEGGYWVITQRAMMRVDVEYLHGMRIGPALFELHFFEPIRVVSKQEKGQ